MAKGGRGTPGSSVAGVAVLKGANMQGPGPEPVVYWEDGRCSQGGCTAWFTTGICSVLRGWEVQPGVMYCLIYHWSLLCTGRIRGAAGGDVQPGLPLEYVVCWKDQRCSQG